MACGSLFRPNDWPPVVKLVLFLFVNIWNYADRGIASGAFDSLSTWFGTQGITNSDTALGWCTSAFIIGYSVASVGVGHMVKFYAPFKLVAVCLLIWCGSVVLSGLAPNYWVLIVGRILSGVGEASFQTVVPPYIEDTAPPAKRGLWLAMFFLAIPVGTAVGYGYGGLMAEYVSWRWAYMLEAVPMFPCAIICWFLLYDVSQGVAAAGGKAVAAGTAVAVTRARGAGAGAGAAEGYQALTASPTSSAAAAAAAGGAAAVRAAINTPTKPVGATRSSVNARTPDGPAGRAAAAVDAAAGAAGAAPGTAPTTTTDRSPLLSKAASRGASGLSTTGGYVSYSAGDLSGAAAAAGVRDAGSSSSADLGGNALAVAAADGAEPVAWDSRGAVQTNGAGASTSSAADGAGSAKDRASLRRDLLSLVCNPLFMLIVAGYASWMAVAQGVGTFASTFIYYMGYASSASSASLIAGAILASAGTVGVPLGGMLMDWLVRRTTKDWQASTGPAVARAAAAAAAGGSASAGAHAGGIRKKKSLPKGLRLGRGKADEESYEGLPEAALVDGAANTDADSSLLLDSEAEDMDAAAAGSSASLSAAGAAAVGMDTGTDSDGGYAGGKAQRRRKGKRSPKLAGEAGEGALATAEAGGAAENADGEAEGDDDEEEDDLSGSTPSARLHKLYISMPQSFVVCVIGAAALLGSIMMTPAAPFGLLVSTMVVGIIIIMMATASVNLAVMQTTPPEHRALAIGLSTFLMHAFGDVPSPTVIGIILDDMSPLQPPGCVHDACTRSKSGLRLTMLFVALWLLWAVAAWGIAWLVVAVQVKKFKATGMTSSWMLMAQPAPKAQTRAAKALLTDDAAAADAAAVEAAAAAIGSNHGHRRSVDVGFDGEEAVMVAGGGSAAGAVAAASRG